MANLDELPRPDCTRRTPRMLLRPLRAADEAEWVRMSIVSESLTAPFSPLPPEGPDPWVQRFHGSLARMADGSSVRLVGILEDGRIAGLFNLNEIVRGPFENAYAGWSVNLEVAGEGYATEGVRGLLDIAFAAPPRGLGLHRVQANVIPRNHRSLRIIEKCGFRPEGLARSYLKIAGEWEDHAMFAMLAEEWNGGEPAPV